VPETVRQLASLPRASAATWWWCAADEEGADRTRDGGLGRRGARERQFRFARANTSWLRRAFRPWSLS
jgi:hypothetical protein